MWQRKEQNKENKRQRTADAVDAAFRRNPSLIHIIPGIIPGVATPGDVYVKICLISRHLCTRHVDYSLVSILLSQFPYQCEKPVFSTLF